MRYNTYDKYGRVSKSYIRWKKADGWSVPVETSSYSYDLKNHTETQLNGQGYGTISTYDDFGQVYKVESNLIDKSKFIEVSKSNYNKTIGGALKVYRSYTAVIKDGEPSWPNYTQPLYDEYGIATGQTSNFLKPDVNDYSYIGYYSRSYLNTNASISAFGSFESLRLMA